MFKKLTKTSCDKRKGILALKSKNNVTIAKIFKIITGYLYASNVTGRHRGPKRKLRAVYRAPSHVAMRRVFIVECGIARFLCAMRLFEVWASSASQLGYLCAKFRFVSLLS